MRERDPYNEVAAAARHAWELACHADPPKGVLKVLGAVIHQTAMFSKFEAPISRSRIREIVGKIDDKEISRSFKWLADREVINYRPGYSIDGHKSWSIVSLPKTGGNPVPRPASQRGTGASKTGGNSTLANELTTRGARTASPPIAVDPVVPVDPRAYTTTIRHEHLGGAA